MAERANPADVFTWRMVDAIAYCADLATAAKGDPAVIARAVGAASQMKLLILPRTVERLEIDAAWGGKAPG
jgi:hypothetical protein